MPEITLLRLMVMAVRLSVDRLHEELAAAGHPQLRPAHGFALNAIGTDGITTSALGSALGMTKQGAAKLVETLTEAGYVEVSPHPVDGRSKTVRLTSRGDEALRTSVAIQRQLEQRWAEVIGTAKLASVREGLEQAVLAENEGEFPPVRPSW